MTIISRKCDQTLLEPFPIDIFGVKKIGVAKWQDSFFWPVTDDEYFSLIDQISDSFLDEIESRNQTLQELLVSNIGIVGDYASTLHALLVSKRFQEKGGEIIFDEKSDFYWELLNERFRSHPNRRYGKGDLLFDQAKQIAKFFRFNEFSLVNIISTFKSRTTVLSLGSFSRLKQEFCKRQERLVFHGSSLKYLKAIQGALLSEYDVGEMEDTANSLTNRIINVAVNNDIPVTDFSRKYLQLATRRSLWTLYTIYNAVLNDDSTKIDVLLLSEVAKPANKAICFALKKKFGTKIIGFEHGNTFGNLVSNSLAINEMAHCDEFVVSTSKSIPNFRKSQEISKFPYGTSTKLVTVDTSFYQELWRKNRSLPLPKKIRTVMLVGFPMNQFRYDEVPGHFSLFHLDLELRLARFFNEHGVRVIYKIHPDRIEEATGIFEGIVHEINPEPFEDVYTSCDAFVFGHNDSSTFGIALCTNKPVLLIEIEGKRWNPRTLEFISKRCKLISAWIDDRNRVIYDEAKLIEHLNEKVMPVHTEFVEQYMVS